MTPKIGCPAEEPRGKIGIISGSGPQAGIDLWQKVLDANRRILGNRYRGDVDAPHVTIISEPALGLSIALEKNEPAVWASLETTVRRISPLIDHLAIACNTLHYCEARLRGLGLNGKLVSLSEVVISHIQELKLPRIALLGAQPVADLGALSPFRDLQEVIEIESAPDLAAVHDLICNVKTLGPDHPEVIECFTSLLEELESENVLLACTELPLISTRGEKRRLIDTTRLVAEELVQRSLGLSENDDRNPTSMNSAIPRKPH